MSIASMICPLALRSTRFDMDHADEPQKKIFKARKTMKVSDRQQLEVVYKVKEDFKLMNGKHENGDSDLSSLNETDCMEDKRELTGMVDVCVDPKIGNSGPKGVTVTSTSDTMENRKVVHDTDLNLTIEPLPADEINYKKDVIHVFSAKIDGQMLETNEEINFIAKNDTIDQQLDQMDPLSCSVSASELCCGKDYIEETVVESGSDKTISVFSEEIVLKSHPEELVVLERQLGENLVKGDLMMIEAAPEISLNEQQVYLNELPLEKPHPVEKADGPQLPETGNIQCQEILEDLPTGILTKDLQQNVEVLTEPELDVMNEEIEMTVERVERVETNLEAQPPMETAQELVQQSMAETGPVYLPQPTGVLAQDSKEEASLIEQRSEQDLTDDQLLEDLAEEQQFGDELAEDVLLNELVEDQPPENVLSPCEVANLVADDQKTSEERDLDVSSLKENPLEMVEKPAVMTVLEEKNPQEVDCESECAEMVEKTENERLLEQRDAIDDFKQKEEGKHDQFEHCAEMECNSDESEKVEEMEEGKILQENNLFEDAGEGAISSSMEMHQAPIVVDITLPEPLIELQNSECCLEKSESMETDDIIPILEKLAPVEDRLASFSKPPLLSEVDQNPELEDKVDCQSSLSKPEHSENLPSEAFLVLSDEEDSCVEEVTPSAVPPSQSSTTENEAVRLSENQLDANDDEPNKDPSPPERSETARRKRSKSEDLDSAQFKRRRYDGEEYEAELQVKITARADVDQKLQKVIQRLLEEKLCALQCVVFDKTLADLKSRVEKIECKKHESVLNGIQAKIARLSKRFGAAKEDLKKRQETQSVQPVQPVQPESPGKAASDGTNTLVQRNVGTVRHILESKRAVDVPASSFQAPANAGPPSLLAQPPPLQAAPNQVLPRIAPTPSSQSPITVASQARQMPDWKLIQQRINATHLAPPQPKPQTPVTSTQVMTPVLSSNTAANVVGTSQVAGGSGGPMPVSLQSLQSLPMILHVPVMQSTMQNATVMQSTTGTLVTNQHSGNIEFIPSQNQGNVGALKTTGSLTPTITTKQNNGLSLPSPTMQRNSPASASSSGPTLSLHAVSVAHSTAQAVRTSLPTVSTAGQYTTTNSRTSLQMKVQTASFSSPSSAEPPATSRTDLQINRTPMSEAIVAKRAAESTTLGGKPGAGVIDLTLDEDEANSSQDGRKTNSMNISGINQPPPILPRPPQLPQTALVQQNAMSAGMPTQTTIHVLPTAQTTVNVNHRPMTQSMPRLSGPRTPTNHQVVYTALPSTAIQSPVRNAVMHGQTPGLRQISPQTGGVAVRMPQTTAYVVNNGMTVGSGGPQLTVHHRPPQVRSEPIRTIHPAPLPEAPQPQRLPPEASNTSLPQKPHLKLARVQSQNGIVLSWSVLEVDRSCASVDSYHLYAYHEDPTASTPSQWKKIGEVKALPLPMACTLTQFVSGSKYYFAVRAKDVYGRFGVFCDPQSTDVIATQNS